MRHTFDETAGFIRGRALSLAYEATKYPATQKVAAAWVRLALAWARQYGQTALVDDLTRIISRIEGEV